ETMAGDVSKRKEAPTVKLNKLRMEEMMSEIMRRMKKKSQSHKQRRPDPRPLSRVSEPLCSKKESAIQKLKTEPSK
ncbi:hypothetical protein HID58_066921, partial [Brassica napus]